MNSDNLEMGAKYQMRANKGTRPVEYIGTWGDSYVFRHWGDSNCVIFNSNEVATEIAEGR